MKSKSFYPIIVLVVICLTVSALIALTNNLTADAIARQNEKTVAESRKTVLPAEQYTDIDENTAMAVTNGQTVGYVFTETVKGYGGELKVLVGISDKGAVTGVRVLSHSETAGVGAVLTKGEFPDRFIGIDSPLGDGEIKKTGASITSKALSDAVNNAIESFSAVTGGDEK